MQRAFAPLIRFAVKARFGDVAERIRSCVAEFVGVFA